ncbi:recombinase family protein [Desulfotruncus alcoholivorax]|uniref:recombinase family protein n=1 Tax=Desulfotruncus alcoholivorax TaxID=265477 RepID=UPI0003F709C9|nr:recombinase family protein [Desulfotruncus alcoholivorax]
MKAVIYARFSSDNQREESITAQARACTEYGRRKGYVIVKTYTDEARSALTDDRPQFQQMIQDARDGLFNVLIIHKLDRFARNRYDSAFYKRELRRAGVKIESVLEHLDDSPESILLESLLEGLAEYYSRNLGREAMKGMKETALQAKHCGGIPPLGLDVDQDRHYIINEYEANAVRLIFEMYDNGFGYDRIIDELNSFGYHTKRGGPYGKNSLHEILKNEKYIGVYTFNKRQGRTADGCKNNRRQKPKDEVIRIPGAIPAIIDEDLFNRVQEKMLKRKHNPEKARQKAKTVFLLSGLVTCGVCGTPYIGNSATNNGIRYGYYECGARDRTRTCTNRRIRKKVLEGMVLDEIDQSIFAPDVRTVLVDKILDFYNQLFSQSDDETRYLEKELKRVQTAINNLLRVIERGQASEALVEQLARREQEAALLQQELDRLAARAAISLTRKDVEQYLDDLYERFKDKENEEQIKPLVQQFVDNVTVFEDEIKVVLKIFLVTSGGGGPLVDVCTVKDFPYITLKYNDLRP